MGKAVTDDDYTDTLFASLPASYNGAISSLSASARLGSKTLTAEIFEQFILDEFERRQVKTKYSESKDEALAADSGKGKGKDKRKDKRKVECFNCHKTGHYKSDCWAKGGGKEGQCHRRVRCADSERLSSSSRSTIEWKGNLSPRPSPRVTQVGESRGKCASASRFRDEKTLLREPYKKGVLLIYYLRRGSVGMRQ
jgi:hypothetical protein